MNAKQIWEEVYYENPEGIRPKKLKLLADQNIPEDVRVLMSEIFNLSIISVASLGLNGHPDENILQKAKQLKRVLLTTDKDFWDERKHPIQKCNGIICIDSGPEEREKIFASFNRFFAFFAGQYSNDWWPKTKASINTGGFILRMRTSQGITSEKEYKIDKGRIFERIIK